MPLTLLGFQKRRLQDIKATAILRQLEEFGNEFLTDDKQPHSKLIAPLLEELALLYEGLEEAYFAKYRESATGTALDAIGAVTGTVRQGASPSTAVGYARGTNGTFVLKNGRIQQTDTDTFFVIADDFSIIYDELAVTTLTQTAGTATCTTTLAHGYADNDWIWVSGASEAEYNGLVQIDNTSANTFDYTVDAGATSPATGTILAQKGSPFNLVSEENGEIVALSGTLTVIETAVSGLAQVSNGNDATLGRLTETDAEYRVSQVNGLSALGNATFEAIKGAISQVQGVTGVRLFNNDTGLVDANGLPAHSFEALVTGGADQDIAEAIFASKSAGIQAFGDISIIVVDSQSENQIIGFSRLTDVDIYIEITITKNTDPNNGPVFGSEAVATATIESNLVAYGATMVAGQDVENVYLFANAITGIEGISSMTLFQDTTASPTTTTTIPISTSEIANIDAVRIVVNYV